MSQQKKPQALQDTYHLPTGMPAGIVQRFDTGEFSLWFEGSPECIPAETILADHPLTDGQKAQLHAELTKLGWGGDQ